MRVLDDRRANDGDRRRATLAGAVSAAWGGAVLCLLGVPLDVALARMGLEGAEALAPLHALLAAALVGLALVGRRGVAPVLLVHVVFGTTSVGLGAVVAVGGGPGSAAIAAVALPFVAWAALVPGGAASGAAGALTILVGALAPSLARPELFHGPDALLGLAACVQAAVGLGALAALAERRRRAEAEARAQLLAAAERDPLTGLSNRRPVDAALGRAGRGAVIVFDLDRFKRINDTLGHEVGDVVLCEVAERLASTLRGADAVGRVGGEEFVAVLRGTSLDEAVRAAERVRRAVSRKPIVFDGRSVEVTISAGVAPLLGDARRALREADGALYRAKAAGRNRVEAAENGESTPRRAA